MHTLLRTTLLLSLSFAAAGCKQATPGPVPSGSPSWLSPSPTPIVSPVSSASPTTNPTVAPRPTATLIVFGPSPSPMTSPTSSSTTLLPTSMPSYTPSAGVPGAPGTTSPRNEPAFNPNPFTVRLRGNEKLDPNSATEIAAMYAVEGHFSMGGIQMPVFGDTLGTSGVTVSVAYATDLDPLFTLHCTEYSNCPEEGQRIHIPAGLMPADGYNVGGEGHTVIINMAEAREDGFYHLRQTVPKTGGTLNIGYGGPCHFDAYKNGGACDEAQTAGNIPLGGILLRAEEFLAAVATKSDLGHALYITTCVGQGPQRWPATSHNGNGNAKCAPMGSRIVLRKTDAQIAALNVPEWTRVIYRTFAHYGMMSSDNNNYSVWTLASEDDNGRISLGMPAVWPIIILLMQQDAAKYHVDLSVSKGSYHIYLPYDTLKQSDMAVLNDLPIPKPSPTPTQKPTAQPTATAKPTPTPTVMPTVSPTPQVTATPSQAPSSVPTTNGKLAQLPHHFLIGVHVGSLASPNTIGALERLLDPTGKFHFDIDTHYVSFKYGFHNADDLANGRIPSMSIAGDNTNVLSGADDAYLAKFAADVAAYRKPVLIRYDWEMNNPRKNLTPATFFASWNYVASFFAPVPNALMYWCPGGGLPVPMNYQPPSYDLAGADIYDRKAEGIYATFLRPYTAEGALPAPLLIGETGAFTNQATYFDIDALAPLPKIIGFTYFDSRDNKNNWELTPAGIDSLRAMLKKLGRI